MADDVTLGVMTGGDVIGADEISSVKYQRVKLIQGANGTNDGDVCAAAPLSVGGGIEHDAGDAGNPIKIGAKALSTIAAVVPVATTDRTDLLADIDGQQLQKPLCPFGDILSVRVSNTDGASTAFTVFDNAANTKNFITTIIGYNSSAAGVYVDIRDGTAGAILMTLPLPAGGGVAISFPVPLKQPTAATALAFDVSAATTTVYLTVIGFKSRVA